MKNRSNHSGFTLVEILVVLVIATVVLSMAIPRIRTVNRERGMREAARVVGSALANASQRARVDGVAGVVIKRNPNFVAGSLQYAATELSLLRSVPNFTGDQQYDENINNRGASKSGGLDTQVQIPFPFEQEEFDLIRAGDSISFNNSSVQFRINNASRAGNFLNLDLDVQANGYPKLPDELDNVPYVVHRQPRILRSSTATLPQNHIIDLRFSGFEVLDGFDPDNNATTPNDIGCFVPPYGAAPVIRRQQLTTIFEPAPTDFNGGVFPAVENYDIEILFDEEGAIDRVLYKDGANVVVRIPLGPIYFLVTQTPDSVDVSGEVATADDSAFWVTVSNVNGSTNIGYNNPLASEGFTYTDFTEFYFAEIDFDPDPINDTFLPERDRDEFNSIINASRGRSATVSANQ